MDLAAYANETTKQFIADARREADGVAAKIAAIVYEPIDVTPERAKQLGDFYTGQEQWDRATRARRDGQARPTLTVNLLPQIVHREIDKLRERGIEVDRDLYQKVVISITAQGEDLMRLYNYLLSSITEAYCTIINQRIEVPNGSC